MSELPSLQPIIAVRAIRRLGAAVRLGICALAGVAVAVGARPLLDGGLAIVLGWVVTVALFLGLTAIAIGDSAPGRVRERARNEDEHSWVIFFILVAAASVSLLALGFLVHGTPSASPAATLIRVLLAGLAVVASWVLVHTTFAFRYAHRFYDARDGGGHHRGGLAFPEETAPDYWDFLYFSFVIGMTCQVSDVQVTSRSMRRLSLAHGVLSFLFNTLVLALAVNFLAGKL